MKVYIFLVPMSDVLYVFGVIIESLGTMFILKTFRQVGLEFFFDKFLKFVFPRVPGMGLAAKILFVGFLRRILLWHGEKSLILVFQGLEFVHFFVCEMEIENVDILLNSIGIDTFWDQNDLALKHLSEKDLKNSRDWQKFF